jgi:hypothetical protein
MNIQMIRSTMLAIGALLYSVAIPARATTITVTNTNDPGPGSLRQALADANDGDTINFAVTGTIVLTNGELLVDKSVAISGPGSASLAVDGNATNRVFHIGTGKTVSMSDLTVTHGNVFSGNGGGILNDHAILTMDSCVVQNSGSELGGGVYNDGSDGSAALTILNSTISMNGATSGGGGIYNEDHNSGTATLTITNSIISNNAVGFADNFPPGSEGGGVYNGTGIMTITRSSVSGNFAGVPGPNFPTGVGGGISNYGTLTIVNSTINSNQCWDIGGGISNSGTLTITNSTVSGNGATGQHDGEPWGNGGGIVGEVTLTNSTVSSNYASLSAGGIEGGGVIGNTLLNNNSGANITGTIKSLGYNLSSDDGGGNLTGPGDQINTDPMLGPLQDNGGPTLTYALLPGSPAINAGDPNFTPPPFNDQRGAPFVRVFRGRIDIGSFEAQVPPRPTPAPRPRPTPPPRP